LENDSKTREGPEKSTDELHGEGTRDPGPDKTQENTVPVDQTGTIFLPSTAFYNKPSELTT